MVSSSKEIPTFPLLFDILDSEDKEIKTVLEEGMWEEETPKALLLGSISKDVHIRVKHNAPNSVRGGSEDAGFDWLNILGSLEMCGLIKYDLLEKLENSKISKNIIMH